jgi:hypothetical protein
MGVEVTTAEAVSNTCSNISKVHRPTDRRSRPAGKGVEDAA